jgi:hypothetical protein
MLFLPKSSGTLFDAYSISLVTSQINRLLTNNPSNLRNPRLTGRAGVAIELRRWIGLLF